MLRSVALIVISLCSTPAFADGFAPIREKDRFLSLVEGRELRLPFYGIRLRLSPDGGIRGSALGWDLTGKWSWKDGYFCRTIDWSGTEIPFNCQLVEARGGEALRFTVDRGAGDSASFQIR